MAAMAALMQQQLVRHRNNNLDYHLVGVRGSQKVRNDGRYHKCGWPNCFYADKCLYVATMKSHYILYHDYPARAPPSLEERDNRLILIDEATYKAERPQWLAQKRAKDLARDNNFFHFNNFVNFNNFNYQQPAPGDMARRCVCYICSKILSTKYAVKTHIITQHQTYLIQEPFQPTRIVEAVVDLRTGRLVRLYGPGPPQQPGFMTVCTEMRQLFFQQVLTVPTRFSSKPTALEQNISRAFAINQVTRREAMDLFSQFNFIIQLNVRSFWKLSLNSFYDSYMSMNMPIVDDELLQGLGQPALKIEIVLGAIPTQGRGWKANTKWRHTITFVYTERGFIELLGAIQMSHDIVSEVRLDFARYASEPRNKEAMKHIKMYLEFLRGVDRIVYYEAGHIGKVDLVPKTELRPGDRKTTKYWRTLVALLRRQLDRAPMGPASMTAEWLSKYTNINGWQGLRRIPHDLPNVPMPLEEEELLENGRNEISEESSVLQLELAVRQFSLAMDNYSINNQEVYDLFEYTTAVHEKSFKHYVFKFPGIPDELRAKAHAVLADYNKCLALWLVRRARESGLVPQDPHYEDYAPCEKLPREVEVENVDSDNETVIDPATPRRKAAVRNANPIPSHESDPAVEENTAMIDADADDVQQPATPPSQYLQEDSAMTDVGDEDNDTPPDPDDLLLAYPKSTMAFHANEAATHYGHAIQLYNSALNRSDEALVCEQNLLAMFKELGHVFSPTCDALPVLVTKQIGGLGGSLFGVPWMGDLRMYPKWLDEPWIGDDGDLWSNLPQYRERTVGWKVEGIDLETEADKMLDELEK